MPWYSAMKAMSACRRSAPCTKGGLSPQVHAAEYGFRLPSCIDNRPLKFEEWDAMRPAVGLCQRTPGNWEMERTGGHLHRTGDPPTGLIDPPVEIRPVESQVDDLIAECHLIARWAIAPWHHPHQEDGRRPH